jgi:hypothetical protein
MATTPRQSSLQTLREQAPAKASQSYKQGQDQQAAQFQRSLSQAPVGDITKQSQQAAGQQQQAGGHLAVGAMKQQQAAEQGAGQLQLQNRATDIQQRASEMSQQSSQKQIDNAKRIAEFGQDKKKHLLDYQMKIHRDAQGRNMLTERQLLDYAIMSSKDEQDFLSWQQDIELASRRNLMMLDAANKKLDQALQQAHAMGEQKMNQAQKREMVQRKRDIEKKIAEAAARAKNRQMKYAAGGRMVGTVAGAVIGTYMGGNTVAGAAAGGAIGEGAGTMVASQTEEEV